MVERSLFSIVESEEDFFKYPFGRESFEKTLTRLDKDMVYFRVLYMKALKKRKKKKAGEAKYTAEEKYIHYRGNCLCWYETCHKS